VKYVRNQFTRRLIIASCVFGFGSYVFLQGIEVCAFVNQTTLFVNQTKRFLNQKISELSKTML